MLYNLLRTITDNGMYWNLKREKRITGLFNSEKLLNQIIKLDVFDYKYNFLKYYITTDTYEEKGDNFTKEYIKGEWTKLLVLLNNDKISILYNQKDKFDHNWNNLQVEDKINVLYSVSRFLDYKVVDAMLVEAENKIENDDIELVSELLDFYKNICKYIEGQREDA